MYVDDRTGGKLDSKLVAAARKKDIKNLEDMGVHVKVPKRVAVAEGAKILDVRWVHIEKADLGMPSNVKSTCVVKDFVMTIRDDLFAGTPALEAVKLIISLVASSRGGLALQKRIMVRRKVYINLSEEATRGDKEEMVGLLKRAMYGTRDASVLAGACQGRDGGAGVRGREGETVRLSAQDSQSCHFGSCG